VHQVGFFFTRLYRDARSTKRKTDSTNCGCSWKNLIVRRSAVSTVAGLLAVLYVQFIWLSGTLTGQRWDQRNTGFALF